MLDVTPSNLFEEIESSRSYIDGFLKYLKEMRQSYVGTAYSSHSTGSEFEEFPENHAYEFISLTKPRVVYDNPRVRVQAGMPGFQSVIAKAMRYGLNRWSRIQKFNRHLGQMWEDMSFTYGVTLTSPVPRPGYDPSPLALHWPVCTRISPRRFFFDQLAQSFDEARYAGHVWALDKNSLLRMAKDPQTGWDAKIIESISADSGTEKLGRAEHAERGVPTRKEIVGYETWVPEHTLPESPGPEFGFHGTIFTLSCAQGSDDKAQEADFIRKPRPYYGPRSGPYDLFGLFNVPDSPVPMGPITATWGQQTDLNDLVRSMNRSGRDYKRIVFVDSKAPDLQKKLKDSPHDWVIPVHGLGRDAVVPVELGGVTDQQLQQLAVLSERMDRNSGISDTKRGNITGRPTATEVTVADTAGDIRFAGMKKVFADCTASLMGTVGWYLYHDDRTVYPLGEEAAKELGMANPVFFGGKGEEGEILVPYEDLGLEIEPYSMERVNEASEKRNAIDLMSIVTQIAPMVPQTPWVNWKEILSKIGDRFNYPDLGEMIDVDMAMLFMGMEGGAPLQGTPEGRFSKSVGGGGGGGRGGQPSRAPAAPGSRAEPAGNRRLSPNGTTMAGDLSGGQAAANRRMGY